MCKNNNGHVMLVNHQQHLDETDENASKIMWMLSDQYCRTILRSIKYTPKSCMDISAECKIPISTTYRRMQELHDQKIVQTSGVIGEDGKKFLLYKSRIQSIKMQFYDRLDVKITYNNAKVR